MWQAFKVAGYQLAYSRRPSASVLVSKSSAGSLIAFPPRLLVTKLSVGETVQLDLFGGMIPAAALLDRRHRR